MKKTVWRLTWVCALLLHDLAKSHCGGCNELSTLPTFHFTLGLVPYVELDLSLAMCMMALQVRVIDEVHEKYDIQKHDFPLIRVLTVYSKHDFVFMLAVDLQGDDRSPGLFGAQRS